MIDLHTHTFCSDGADSPETLLKNADKLGLEAFSITDHNTVAAYRTPAVQNWRQLYGGRLIPGIEITCMLDGEVVEVLGYGYDLAAMERELAGHVLPFAEKQRREFELITVALQKAGLTFDPAQVVFDPARESCRKSLLAELNRCADNRRFFGGEKSWQSSRAFARQEIYNPQSRLYVDESPLYPSVKTAVGMIHAAGGIAFWAHLHEYAHAADYRAHLDTLVPAFGLDGMEAAHSCYSPAQIQDLEGYCNAHDLLCSGGSDYHGARKPDIALGVGRGQLAIPLRYLERWPHSVLTAAAQFDAGKTPGAGQK